MNLGKSLFTKDRFLFFQLKILGLMALSCIVVAPAIKKLEGLSLSLETLSLLAIMYHVVKLTLQLDCMKKITLRQSYLLVMISDLLLAASTTVYFIDPEVFIYTNYCAVVVQGLLLRIFSINYYAFISEKYGKNTFKNLQFSESLIINIVAIIGSTLAFVQAEFFSIDAVIKLYFGILVVSFCYQYRNYSEFRQLIDSNETGTLHAERPEQEQADH